MNQHENKNELMVINDNSTKQSEFSLAAKLILDSSILMFNRQLLMRKIDTALISGDKEEFLELSKLYSQLN
jgi:uncharacterized protein YpiB (UPF0302 family)